MSKRHIGTCDVEGDNDCAGATCGDCGVQHIFLAEGPWEKAKHWAMTHVCSPELTGQRK